MDNVPVTYLLVYLPRNVGSYGGHILEMLRWFESRGSLTLQKSCVGLFFYSTVLTDLYIQSGV